MSKEDLRRAEIRSRFKKATPEPEPTIDEKYNKALATISQIFADFNEQFNKESEKYKKKIRNNEKIIIKPISNYNLKQIIKICEKYKILLIAAAINCLYLPINRNNVGIIISYFDKRIEDFFNSQNLLPPTADPLYQINLLNLCIKVKKENLKFDNVKFQTKDSKDQLFRDMECLKGACNLYVWHVKINECVPLNNLNLSLPDKGEEGNRKSEFLTVYTPLIGRKCKIVNAPIIDPPKDAAQLADEAEGVESQDTDTTTNKTNDGNTDGNANESTDKNADEDTDENTEESVDENKNVDSDGNVDENTDTNSDQTASETEQINDDTTNNNSNNQSDNPEQFMQYNLDFIKNYKEDDYIYFILVALLLTSLFFIYLRYK